MARYVIGCATVYPTRREWDYDHDYRRRLRERLAALPAGAYPHMHELAEDVPKFTQQEAFDFGLERLLGSVAEAAGAPRSPGEPHPGSPGPPREAATGTPPAADGDLETRL